MAATEPHQIVIVERSDAVCLDRRNA
jgi:hypothetical protein